MLYSNAIPGEYPTNSQGGTKVEGSFLITNWNEAPYIEGKVVLKAVTQESHKTTQAPLTVLAKPNI